MTTIEKEAKRDKIIEDEYKRIFPDIRRMTSAEKEYWKKFNKIRRERNKAEF